MGLGRNLAAVLAKHEGLRMSLSPSMPKDSLSLYAMNMQIMASRNPFLAAQMSSHMGENYFNPFIPWSVHTNKTPPPMSPISPVLSTPWNNRLGK
ncbi:hypothetical protein Bhyg_02685 [Pseudolycoriella hygida]|uniref:Uncharacterized protein n=1 Tax=Pseudolycoriella hygida TaxID=35572 RepID=A0A9Q0NBX1_9DIPT|nr:hypothetical protein Bhyg_02685 [Pseudolycoriella hygida]